MEEKRAMFLSGVSNEIAERVTDNMIANPRLEGLNGFNPIRSARLVKGFDGSDTIILSTSAMLAWFNVYCATHGISPRICEIQIPAENNRPFMEKVQVDIYFDNALVATGIASGLYESTRNSLSRDDATRLQSTATKAKRRALEMAGFSLLDDGQGVNPEDVPQYLPDVDYGKRPVQTEPETEPQDEVQPVQDAQEAEKPTVTEPVEAPVQEEKSPATAEAPVQEEEPPAVVEAPVQEEPPAAAETPVREEEVSAPEQEVETPSPETSQPVSEPAVAVETSPAEESVKDAPAANEGAPSQNGDVPASSVDIPLPPKKKRGRKSGSTAGKTKPVEKNGTQSKGTLPLASADVVLDDAAATMTLEEAENYPCEFPSMKGKLMKQVWESTALQTFAFWCSDNFKMRGKYPGSVMAAKVIYQNYMQNIDI